MSAKLNARFSPDDNRFSGGWRPYPGADETVNAPRPGPAVGRRAHGARLVYLTESQTIWMQAPPGGVQMPQLALQQT